MDFERAQLEWKVSQDQLCEQIAALQEAKESLEAQSSQLTSQLDEALNNMEQQKKSSKLGADKVRKGWIHGWVELKLGIRVSGVHKQSLVATAVIKPWWGGGVNIQSQTCMHLSLSKCPHF